ncbi:PD40 domain-containing protein [Labilibaculum filiforme]|nr:PD40 domain-containing protein [Labilibaculum filiforme]
MNNKMRLHYGLFFLSFFLFQFSFAQNFNGGKTEQQIEQEAFTFFDAENFTNALPLYQELINVYPQDPEYNYYLGVCQVEENKDVKEAIQHLKIASTKNVNASVPYFLGRAFHMNYEFNSAIRYYRKFSEYYKKKSVGIDRLIEMCQNGLPLVNSYYVVDVKNKKVVSSNEFFRYYDIDGFEDRLSKKDKSLTSRYDGEGDKEVACLANKGQYIYFSSVGKNKKTGRDLFRAKRLKNGGWGEWEELKALNSDYDEVYPFMSNDGRTLYFCSQGHTSMGGFDIFKSVYNEISDTWTEPQNMGFPINSTSNDLFFATDLTDEYASFASSRDNGKNEVTIYKIKLSDYSEQKVVMNPDLLANIASLSIGAENVDGNLFQADTEELTYSNKYRSNDFPYFNFPITGELTYHYLNEFKSGDAREVFIEAKNDQFNSDSLIDYTDDLRGELNGLEGMPHNVLANKISKLEQRSFELSKQAQNKLRKSQSEEADYLNKNIIGTVTAEVHAPATKQQLVMSSEVIPASGAKTEAYRANKAKEGYEYHLQVGVFSNRAESSFFLGLKDVKEEVVDNGKMYKYMVGSYPTFAAAKKEIPEVRQLFPNTFVVAYKDGVKASLSAAIKATDQDYKYEAKPAEQVSPAKTTTAVVNEQVSFRVQVGAYATEVPEDVKLKLKRFSKYPIDYSKDYRGYTICTVGDFDSYSKVSKLKMELREAGLGDAFTVAFSGNDKITIQQALEILRQ